VKAWGGNAQNTNTGHPEPSRPAGGHEKRAGGEEETIMSSSSKLGGGWVWLLLVIATVGLAATKPSEAAHRDAFAKRTPVTRALFGVAEVVGGAELKYHDYFLFSTMTAKLDKNGREIPITIGLLGKVYYGEDK
jgi:hypothetical protein